MLKIHPKFFQKKVKLVPKYDPAGSRNPAGFSGEIPQSRGIEKTRDLVNRSCLSFYEINHHAAERILDWVGSKNFLKYGNAGRRIISYSCRLSSTAHTRQKGVGKKYLDPKYLGALFYLMKPNFK